ncbi:hypothetical protein DZG01_10635 [Pseudomonas fluorescens]|nr:hypothetical protein DZG01_10635 [Pseudomonas fluorescens]
MPGGRRVKPVGGAACLALWCTPPLYCVCELARDSGATVSLDVECQSVIASRLAPTGNPSRTQQVCSLESKCGSEPARDSDGSVEAITTPTRTAPDDRPADGPAASGTCARFP